ncbi:hypothetical protein HYH03_012519 [Edaphochlamys debaryana]|uniref:Uncharacterized protein n=1 Tax=Edaphochlamys debaryana TaxID=47281 RepID=A0A836BVD2_9CHLO|nr:hypothetical protein HYH03_012519 [Edaphochlamys debaryana]|eukprot:KAG2488889.1 hypothetical protein HYH03_012519 [Edaphochlamys debaryana]
MSTIGICAGCRTATRRTATINDANAKWQGIKQADKDRGYTAKAAPAAKPPPAGKPPPARQGRQAVATAGRQTHSAQVPSVEQPTGGGKYSVDDALSAKRQRLNT